MSIYRGWPIVNIDIEKPVMIDTRFKIGNKVKIVRPGGQYSTYTAMAEKMNLDNYENGYMINEKGLIGTVVGIKKHHTCRDIVVGIRLSNGRDIIMTCDAIKLLDIIPSDMFKL